MKRFFSSSLLTELQPILLILFVFLAYLFKSVFFVFNVPHFDFIILALTIAAHTATAFLIYGKEHTVRQIIFSLLSCYAVILASCFLCTLIYDIGYDGLAYHQPAAIQMVNGWNPFYTTLQPDERSWLWVNHYAKFTETYGAFFGALFSNIEAGKSYSIVFFIAMFLWVLKFVSRYQKSKIAIFTISVLFVANPIVVGQLFTYLVDGALGMTIMLLIFTMLEFEKGGKRRYLLVAFALSVIAINIKFTGLIVGFVWLAYLVRQLYLKKYGNAKQIVWTGIAVLLVGVLFTGFNPYVRNFICCGHPFYPLFGENKVDIITGFLPDYMMEKNYWGRLATLFAPEVNACSNIPFNPIRFSQHIKNCIETARWGGFGLFFLEIWLLIGAVFVLSVRKKSVDEKHKTFLFPSFLLLAMALITPENYWARYISYFWYAPFLFLIPCNISKQKILAFVLTAFVLFNSGAAFGVMLAKGFLWTKRCNEMTRTIKNNPNHSYTVEVRAKSFIYTVENKFKEAGVDNEIIFMEKTQNDFYPVKDWRQNE